MKTHNSRVFAVLTAAVLVTVLFVSACGSTPSPVVPAQLIAPLGGGRPSWIDNYPADPAFYIGVGSSKTGDRGSDMEAAKYKALVALAGSISTEIRSELFITAREDSEGGAYQAAEQVIRETVAANLKDVEVADSYYSADDGYWFYLRLSKAVWKTIQREEADRLARRVVGIVEPSLTDDSISIISRLGALWKGWLLLVESPYSSLIETALGGENGVLLDLIENRLIGYVDTLSVAIKPAAIKTAPGKPAPVEIVVQSSLAIKPGETSVVLSFPGTGYESIEVSTKADGVYTGRIIFPLNEPGSVRIKAGIDFARSGLDFERVPKRFVFPETDAMLVVSPVTVSLEVKAPAETDFAHARGSFESLISSKLPVELTRPGKADYEINVEVVTRSAPPNEYGLIIVFTKAFVSVGKDGNIFASYESPEAKEGGLTSSQAYARSLAKLFEHLEASPELAVSLEKAFSIEAE